MSAWGTDKRKMKEMKAERNGRKRGMGSERWPCIIEHIQSGVFRG